MREPPAPEQVPVTPELPAMPQREDPPSSTDEHEDRPSLPCSAENPRRFSCPRSTPERLTTTKLGFPVYYDENFVTDSGTTMGFTPDLESYFKQEPTYLIPSFMAQVPYLNLNLAHPFAFKANATGKAKYPDLFSYDLAM